jgi:hypothetical protein
MRALKWKAVERACPTLNSLEMWGRRKLRYEFKGD